MSFPCHSWVFLEIIYIFKLSLFVFSISRENASIHLKSLEYLYVVQFEAQYSFRQYLSSFTYLKKKVISDHYERISEITTFCYITNFRRFPTKMIQNTRSTELPNVAHFEVQNCF